MRSYAILSGGGRLEACSRKLWRARCPRSRQSVALGWKSYREDRAARVRVGGRERAAVFGGDAVREREADAVAFGLGREEGDEDARQVGFGYSSACVFDLDARPSAARLVALV